MKEELSNNIDNHLVVKETLEQLCNEERLKELTLDSLLSLLGILEKNNVILNDTVLKKVADHLQEKKLVYKDIFSKIINQIEDKEYLRILLNKFGDFDQEKLKSFEKENEETLAGSHDTKDSLKKRFLVPQYLTEKEDCLLPEGKDFYDFVPPNRRPFDSLPCQIIKKLDPKDRFNLVIDMTYRPQTRLFALSLLTPSDLRVFNVKENDRIKNMIVDLFSDRDEGTSISDTRENNLKRIIIESTLFDDIREILRLIISTTNNPFIKQYARDENQKLKNQKNNGLI